MLNIRKYNLILINTVLLLFLVGLLVGLKILFTGNNIFGGSITDWISALSTAGTLGVAYAAYRKAPEWMTQKHYEIAYKIVDDAIYNDLSRVRTSSLHLKFLIVKLGMNLNLALSQKDNSIESEELNTFINAIETDLDKLFILTYSITNRLKSVSRYNYHLTDYSKKIISELQEVIDEFNDIHESILTFSTEFEILFGTNDDSTINETIHKGREIQKQTIVLNNRILQFIKGIYSDNKPITNFIYYKKP